MDKQASEIIKRTISLEGGYVDHQNDTGGETKYGITSRSYPHVDIKNLTKDKASQIYYDDYYTHRRLNAHLIPDKEIAFKVFDLAVNAGPVASAKIFQGTVNHFLPWRDDIKEDGWVGPNTVKAYKRSLSDIRVEDFLIRFMHGQMKKYIGIMIHNRSQIVFGRGWVKRAFSRLDKTK